MGDDNLKDVDDEVGGGRGIRPSWNLLELHVSVGPALSGKASCAHRAWVCPPSCGGAGTPEALSPLPPEALRL